MAGKENNSAIARGTILPTEGILLEIIKSKKIYQDVISALPNHRETVLFDQLRHSLRPIESLTRLVPTGCL